MSSAAKAKPVSKVVSIFSKNVVPVWLFRQRVNVVSDHMISMLQNGMFATVLVKAVLRLRNVLKAGSRMQKVQLVSGFPAKMLSNYISKNIRGQVMACSLAIDWSTTEH